MVMKYYIRSNSVKIDNSNSSVKYLNDLWRYNGNWTWISGNTTGNQKGNYGTKGVSSPTNFPSSRYHAVSWVDNDRNFWMFGGLYANGSNTYYLHVWIS
jgi:hypothetical protein